MTPEGLKEIEERYAPPLRTLSLNNLARLGAEAHRDIPKLLAYIKELEHVIEMLSGVSDELSARWGTFRDELRKEEK